MTVVRRRPWLPASLVLLVLSCSTSSGSSSQGCGSGSTTQTCDIDTMATTCPGQITLECHDGAVPYSKKQCTEAIQQDTETVYCCVNDAAPAADGGGGSS
ncbi:MAG TPA: hypothetical protein VHB21_07040 [Minicystis sp.]|nr:hypothetical protein [Minicystis sp.]